MAISLRDIVLAHVDEALDIDDLETMGDFVRSIIVAENLPDWQLGNILKQLYADLLEAHQTEKDRFRRVRLKSAISHFEADFSDLLIAKETGTLLSHD